MFPPHTYLSGDTIGMWVGGTACSVPVGRLVGGLGRSELVSVIVSSLPGVAL